MSAAGTTLAPRHPIRGAGWPWPIWLLHATTRAMEAVGWVPGRLDVDRLLEEASARNGGRTDFGDPGFREGLERMVDLHNTPGSTSFFGRKAMAAMAVRALDVRLDTSAILAEDPEVATAPLRAPVFIVGLPRTGTTLLFNLLACDPRFRPLRYYEATYPTPCGPELEAARRDRMERLRQLSFYMVPEFQAVHSSGLDSPEECVLLLANSFRSMGYCEGYLSPFREWHEAQDPRPAYAEYATWLRILDKYRPRPGDAWLLKSPLHLRAIDVLAELFPDAVFIQTHRDPGQSMISTCSLVFHTHRFYGAPDVADIAEYVPAFWRRSLELGLAARENVSNRFADVQFRELTDDPVATVRKLYGTLDSELSSAVEAAMRELLQGAPRHHERHHYRAEDFGLAPLAIRDRMSAYCERFDL